MKKDDEMNDEMEEEAREERNLLDQPINEKAVDFVSKELSKALLKITTLKKDYGYSRSNFIMNKSGKIVSIQKLFELNDTETEELRKRFHRYDTDYIKILVKILVDKSVSVRDLFKRSIQIIVFLNIPEAKTFKHRISSEYYLPHILATLSPSEMFPELYDNPKHSSDMVRKITEEINDKSLKMLVQYNKMFQLIKTNLPEINFTTSIQEPDRKSSCSNISDVKDLKEEDIVYYNEDGVTYCFDEDKFNLLLKNKKNPFTNKNLDETFIKNFMDSHNMILAKEGLDSSNFNKYKQSFGVVKENDVKENVKELPKEKINEKELLAPGLWKIVYEHLHSFDGEGEGEFSESKQDDSSSYKDESSSYKDESKLNEDEFKEMAQQLEDACENCKKYKSNDSIKTIVRLKDDNKMIKFCDFVCMKDWEVKKSIRKMPKKPKPNTTEEVIQELLDQPPSEPQPALIQPQPALIQPQPALIQPQPEPSETQPVKPTVSNIVEDISKSTGIDANIQEELSRIVQEEIKKASKIPHEEKVGDKEPLKTRKTPSKPARKPKEDVKNTITVLKTDRKIKNKKEVFSLNISSGDKALAINDLSTDLSKNTVVQLKQLAEFINVTGYKSMLKGPLLEAITPFIIFE
jgi:hypothetical protein